MPKMYKKPLRLNKLKDIQSYIITLKLTQNYAAKTITNIYYAAYGCRSACTDR